MPNDAQTDLPMHFVLIVLQMQNSLMMFPSMVTQLMDKCGVVIDPQVATHAFFGVQAELW